MEMNKEEERLVEVEVECEDEDEEEDKVLLSYSYRQLVDDSHLFYRQLSLFHSSSPSLSVTVGGTHLDLHRLFVHVTSRGGLLQVIKDRKWKDVVSALQLPTSDISASFLLRKYYIVLLYHFEHLYFFRNTTCPPHLSSSPTTPTATDVANHAPAQSTSFTHDPANTKILPGVSFVGVIDEKFDNGYVVSVNVGSEQLRGILYHIPDRPPVSPIQKMSSLALMDPSKPKLIGKPDNFCAGRYAALTPISQEQEDRISETVGHIWNISPVTNSR